MSNLLKSNKLIFLLLSIPVFLLTFRASLILDDPFHYGEYFASLIGYLRAETFEELPFTIHGALDFFPAYFVKDILMIENHFIYTKLLFHILHFISSFLLIFIANMLLKSDRHRILLLFTVALISPLIVSHRDLFLLTSVLLFLVTINQKGTYKSRIFLEILFGLFVGLGVFWSFDRGIATAVSLGIAILYLLYKEKTHIASLFSFFFTIGYISILTDVFPIEYYYANIKFLMDTSSNWSYGLALSAVVLSLYAIVLNILIISIFSYYIFNIKIFSNKNISLFIAFLIFSIFMIKMGINRADTGHVAFTLLFPLLMLIIISNDKPEVNKKIKMLFLAFMLLSFLLSLKLLFYPFALISALAFFIFSLNLFSDKYINTKNIFIGSIIISLVFVLLTSYKAYSNNKYNWIELLSKNPANNEYVEDSMKWVSSEIKNSNSKCVFDLSNNGIINGLINLPSCTKYTYLVYADKRHEENIINQLKINSPEVIVYSTTYWSYSIDGKSMKERFKSLDSYILENYKYEACKYGYCLRSSRQYGDFK